MAGRDSIAEAADRAFGSDLDLLGHFQSVIHLDTQVADGSRSTPAMRHK